MSVKTHNIERSLRHMVVGARLAQDRKRDQDDLLTPGEIDQEFQVEISGEATGRIGWNEQTVFFEWPFMGVPEMRESSPYEEPTFTYGYQSEAGVVLTARLVKWVWDVPRGLITGVVVSFGAYIPGATAEETAVKYKGTVHLMFQGFAMPPDDDDAELLGS